MGVCVCVRATRLVARGSVFGSKHVGEWMCGRECKYEFREKA